MIAPAVPAQPHNGGRKSVKALALLAGFAMLSSGLVMGAASPALAEEPVAVEETAVPADDAAADEAVVDESAELAEDPAAQSTEMGELPAPVVESDGVVNTSEAPAGELTARNDDKWSNFPEPVMTGDLQVGKKLTVKIAPLPANLEWYSYQWYRVDTAANADKEIIYGATGLTYTLTRGDIGMAPTFVLQFKTVGGESQTKYSQWIGNVVTPAPFNFVAPASSPFEDVAKNDKFFAPVSWMSKEGLSTGVKTDDGRDFQPKSGVSREAMAAFLYRHQGSKYKGPKTSPFSDVKPNDKFYNEIAWMHKTGLSTGVKTSSGKSAFAPKAKVTREAMAAFIYRLEGASTKAPGSSSFTDMKRSDKFFKEIAWMGSSGLSTGVKQSNGKYKYAPKATVSREAMAAFLYRLESK